MEGSSPYAVTQEAEEKETYLVLQYQFMRCGQRSKSFGQA
jgi:hypothetical protein